MEEWQNIETAPKDGTRAILFDASMQSVEIGWWDDRSSKWVMNPDLYEGHYWEVYASHWQPLPHAPSAREATPPTVAVKHAAPLTDDQVKAIAKAAGFSLECWMTNPPKPSLWIGSPEAMRKLLTAEHMPGAADWQGIDSAPQAERVLIVGRNHMGAEEIAMAWLDSIDSRWYYAPQGGLVQWKPTQWRGVPDAEGYSA